jgi:hypothetical protein
MAEGPAAGAAGTESDTIRNASSGSDSSEASGGAATSADRAPRRAAEPIVEPEEARGESQHAMVALPGTHRVEPRPSLWKRITMRSGSFGESGTSRLIARLDVIEARVVAAETSLANRMQQLDERFSEVWEIEEQISQMNDLRETLAEVASRQVHLDARINGIKRRLTLLSLAIGAAAVAAVVVAVSLR